MNEPKKTEVLITVLTYPHPSRGYGELVCTAGITRDFEWVRLYPIDYRYLPRDRKFHKYQWIEVELADRGEGNDNRKESRKPNNSSIRLIGAPLDTNNKWQKREEIFRRMPVRTVNELRSLYESEKVSLGIVKPTEVIDLIVEDAEKDWKPEWQEIFDQFTLFGTPPKPLKKIPFKFSYVFKCADNEKPHKAMIEDWELGALYLGEESRLGTPEKAAASVKKKYLDELCSKTKDTHFYMGTTFPWNSWVCLGVYWPPVNPAREQRELW